ncbi:DUF2442 domain-containing protein [candidate division WOR-3 bacterium]|uniref:DUF2442 domain-containing protein n=1 Tax=candidate division WOR-3 bacterium TaxID=2052148 RepID=A0A937XE86_UNCW3|nr:DUF2442 domain-containing protein [candidate division WOR-3 bacterium]
MSILAAEPQAIGVSFDADTMWVDLADGRRLGVPLAYFPRLLRATPAQRQRCVIGGSGIGLHWDDLDEDILVSGLLHGVGDRTRSEQPESAVARDRKSQA